MPDGSLLRPNLSTDIWRQQQQQQQKQRRGLSARSSAQEERSAVQQAGYQRRSTATPPPPLLALGPAGAVGEIPLPFSFLLGSVGQPPWFRIPRRSAAASLDVEVFWEHEKRRPGAWKCTYTGGTTYVWA
ncbi:hypothetical protein ColTof4_10188 [Colletotrichum tofieldiae]|nr:hypothetical protein ColTof3_06150 [Colletotrichum tofieldiae]GKT77765.1 hypothetical protein ColTof4_10188 [Colletotrichum tofieldiae]